MKASLKFILFILCLALTAKLVLFYKSNPDMGCYEMMEKFIKESF